MLASDIVKPPRQKICFNYTPEKKNVQEESAGVKSVSFSDKQEEGNIHKNHSERESVLIGFE